jgi:hypothetical protein
MNKFNLIDICSCYYSNSKYITISAYKNNNSDEIYTIEYETPKSWCIEWFKTKKCCKELKKIILWLNEKGSIIKNIEGKICLIGVNLYNLNQTITTDTFIQIPFNINYTFDYDILEYSDVPSLKTHLNKEHKINNFDTILE